MLNIKYDIVGSFLRPKEIHDARKKFFNKEISLEELTKIEDVEISKLVEKEVKHGLKIVTDGEFRRRWWHLDWLNEFDGFETVHLDKVINGMNHHIEYQLNRLLTIHLCQIHLEVETHMVSSLTPDMNKILPCFPRLSQSVYCKT